MNREKRVLEAVHFTKMVEDLIYVLELRDDTLGITFDNAWKIFTQQHKAKALGKRPRPQQQ